MGFAFAQLLTGLANASSLFLVASGLSIIFGVTRVVNFAHGSLTMLGAYLTYSLVTHLPSGVFGFWGSMLLAPLAVALIGGVVEVLVLRRIYRAPELFQLVATFGIVLIVADATLAIWGAEDLLAPRAPGLGHAVRILGEPVPQYDLLLIAVGPLVLGLIWLVLHRTRWGLLVRAATADREMVGALGVDEARLFTGVFMLGSFLAGLGGALQTPREVVSLSMDLGVIAEAFVVVVIGGMGSVTGAFVAAVIIGVLNAFGILVLPTIAMVLPFLVMAVVLVIRPHGLFGRPEMEAGTQTAPEAPLQPLGRPARLLLLVGLALLALSPLVLPTYGLVLGVDFLIAALFAASLHLMMGVGGMISFGHAAYFGLGAYGAALASARLGLPMLPSMLVGVGTGFLGALLFGWLCVRLSGVYLAMLTLAAAQIVWSAAMQWRGLTGGDDGILSVWPDAFASSRTAYFLLTLAVATGALALIRRIAHSPFGYALRATRDSALRAEAIGLNVTRHRWAAFTLAGSFAALAGALFVFAKGSVFPNELAISRSVDALVMVLLGGIQALSGPILGATVFTVIEDWISRFDYWRFIFGLIILLVVVAAPDGIAGGLKRLALWTGLARRRAGR
ncbi:ABC transporter permease [Consotaella aegiceratis]|uniref:ABC transporter permease n=1 Tax=Consotaella aegiceratis TaxID=3097961 RepID=UPI002F3F6468